MMNWLKQIWQYFLEEDRRYGIWQRSLPPYYRDDYPTFFS